MVTEINFDGIVGPSHNYAGLSLGNLASTRNYGKVSEPRAAALQGLAKIRANLERGVAQGFFLPHRRPDTCWLQQLGTTVEAAEPRLRANAMSASAMWAANAATVSPAADTADGRCHLTVANLMTMPHRSHEWRETLFQLRLAFADTERFAVHAPIPAPFGDEGAANHMRLCARHDAPGVEIFVYGHTGAGDLDPGPYPARQHREASAAIARRHGLDPERTILVRQSEEAIASGAFHNDVVAVANERVLFAHENAFANREGFYAELRAKFPEVEIIEIPASEVSLFDAIQSYLFNAQLITQPSGEMALILPTEARESPSVWPWLERLVAGNGPIRQLFVHDLRQSMANGGGPACLRLRVVADPAAIDPRFIATTARLDRIEALIARLWPEQLSVDDLSEPAIWAQCLAARAALCRELELPELEQASY
ncbi:N-succinylarginine dihydrolase [Sphingomonas sp. IC081]|uniref:N-succinylarginine dihydrolase n=1 Tax=Sphingomonas sp. IC081 TaxID=304378 RepID=UPI0011575A64|nr:N-succinylarginine dihydrolase [Sphingomonas sp. IC081]QDK31307.1 succinylarginine dihydrolase [Sphingomonas sp. IC081]